MSRRAPWLFFRRSARRRLPVLVMGIVICNLLVVLLAWLGPDRYVCEWSLILPAADTEASVNLANVGQARAGARSFLDGRVLDHRVNYRQVLLGPTVQEMVAAELQIEASQVPRPRVRLLDQSSIFTVELRSKNAQQALEASEALLRAFQMRIQELRGNETGIRRAAVELEVRRAEEVLAASSARLSEFRRSSGLVSEDQVEITVRRLDEVQARLLERRAHLAGLRSSVQAQLAPIGLTTDQVKMAFSLSKDGIFMELAARYRETVADLNLRAKSMGLRHPLRIELQAKVDRAWLELTEVAEERLGRQTSAEEVSSLFSLLSHESADKSLTRLAELLAEEEATAREVTEWQNSKATLEILLDTRVKALAELAVLTNLSSLDQAMLGSSKAQADVGGQKPFASYPLVQVLESPVLPQQPVRLHPILWLLAAVLASGCWCVGVFLWDISSHIGAES